MRLSPSDRSTVGSRLRSILLHAFVMLAAFTPVFTEGITFPPPAPSVPKNALQFGGGTQFVEVSKPEDFNLSNALTVEFWLYVAGFDRSLQTFVSKGESWSVARSGNTSKITFRTKNGNSFHELISVANLQTARWYHIAAVYNGSTKFLYIDGKLDNSGAYNVPLEPVNVAVNFAANAQASNRNHRGQLESVRIWSIARSLPEIWADLDRNLHGTEPGLLGEWRFNEPSGTIALDSSAAQRNGTLRNMAETDRVNGFAFRNPPPLAVVETGAIRFEGDDRQYVTPNEKFASAFNLTGSALTIEAWVNVATFDKPSQAIVTKGNAWGIVRSASTSKIAFRTGANELVSISELVPNRWYHIAAVYNGANKYLYIDGVPEGTNSYSVPLTASSFPLLIGGNAEVLDRAFKGTIDSVRVWSVARGGADIVAAMQTELRGSEAGLLANWRFNEAVGPAALDQSYSERHATLVGFREQNRVPGLQFQVAPPAVATVPKNALRFTGAAAGPRVVINSESPFNLTEKITIEAWVNVGAFDKPWQAIVTKGEAWGLTRANATSKIAFRTHLGFGAFDLESQSELQAGRWYHVAAVFDGSQKLLYIDGNLEGSVPFNGKLLLNSEEVALGGNTEVSDRGFNGRLDTVRIWSEPRTVEQIRSQLDRDLRGSEPGLLGDWRFNESSGGDALDSSQNGLNGTLTAMDVNADRVDGLLFRPPASGDLALRFDQSGATMQFVSLPDESQFDLPNQLTIETWVYFDELPTGVSSLVSKGAGAWGLKLRPSGKIQFATPGLTDASSNPQPDLLSATTLAHGEWHHVAATWHPIRKEKIIYINGIRDASDAGLEGTWGQNNLSAIFAASAVDGTTRSEHFSGALDEVRIWQVARSEDQIRESVFRRLNGTEPLLTGVWSFDEGSGAQAADGKAGGTALPGTLQGGMSSFNRIDGVALGVPAPSQYALIFNGVDEYVQIPETPAMILAGSATFEAWIKPDGTGQRTILYKGASGYGLALDANNYARFFVDSQPANSLSSNRKLENNVWAHVAVVVNGPAQTTTFFIDGKAAGVHGVATLVNSAGALFLGKQGTLIGNYYKGEMDEVRVWNVARSNLEIEFLAFRSLPLDSAGLLGYWALNDGKGTAAKDSSSNRTDGALTGMDSSNWSQGQVWPVAALDSNVQLAANPAASGLWIGQIVLNKVNEVQKAVNGAAESLTPTADTATVRVLLHVNGSGQVRLLKNVTVMQTPLNPQNPTAPRTSVLVTDPTLLPQFEGVVSRGGKMVGLRYGSAAFDFPGTSLQMLGGVGPGVGCLGAIVIGENHPTNPFRHKYHPDHRQGFTISRQFSVQFDGQPSEGLSEGPGYGTHRLTGKYRETITGLHKIPLKTEGTISISRISSVALLNNQP